MRYCMITTFYPPYSLGGSNVRTALTHSSSASSIAARRGWRWPEEGIRSGIGVVKPGDNLAEVSCMKTARSSAGGTGSIPRLLVGRAPSGSLPRHEWRNQRESRRGGKGA